MRSALGALAGCGLALAISHQANAYSGGQCGRDPDAVHSIRSQITELTVEIRKFSTPSEGKACALVARGLLYHFEGEYERAIADYISALHWMRNFSTADEMLGDAYEDSGQHDKALAAYAEAASLSKETSEGLNGRCWSRAVRGHPLDRALADCDESLREAPNEFYTLDSRCLVHFRRGEYQLAIDDCEAALKLMPNYASSLYVRGLAKLRLGDSAGGNADISAAKDSDHRIADYYTLWGVKP